MQNGELVRLTFVHFHQYSAKWRLFHLKRVNNIRLKHLCKKKHVFIKIIQNNERYSYIINLMIAKARKQNAFPYSSSPTLYTEVQRLANVECHSLWMRCDSCLLYTSPSPRDKRQSRMPSSA